MRILLLPWRLITWLWRKLRAFFAWIREMLGRFFGAPIGAVARVIKRIIAWIKRAVEAFIAAWERIWARNPVPRDKRRPRHIRSCILLATLTTGVLLYATPFAREIHARTGGPFTLLTFGVFVLSTIIYARWSSTDLEHWFVTYLWRVRQRTGLVSLERLGAVLALALLVSANAGMHRGHNYLWSMEVLVGFVFVALLSDAYLGREPSRAPTMAPPMPDDSGAPGLPAKTFKWRMAAGDLVHECELSLAIDMERYKMMRDRNPHTGFDPSGKPHFADWVVTGTTPEVDRIAATFNRWCVDNSWSQFIEVCLALSFAQHIIYRSDEETTGVPDYWRYPIETLVDGVGDCEDMSILAAAILRRMGHTVGLFVTSEHAALAVSAPPGILTGHSLEVDGRRYYYCETTEQGWQVGQLPSGVDPAALAVSLIEGQPMEAAA